LDERYTSRAHASARFFAQRLLLKPLVWSLLAVKVFGREHLRGFTGAAVVTSNHSSHLDTPLILGGLPRQLGVRVSAGAASDYFFKVWWRKPLTALFFNAFPVDRTGSRGRNSITTQLLDAGVPLLIYAEGTRSRTGAMGRFKPGSAALSISRNVPIIPASVVGAYEAMPYKKLWPKLGRPPVRVVFDRPVFPEPGETPRALSERVAGIVKTNFDRHAQDLGLPTLAERAQTVKSQREEADREND